MVRGNQIYLDHEDDIFVCIPCNNRRFPSATGLFQHVRSSQLHRDEWCERCQWLFVSHLARAAHVRSSDVHHPCIFCGDDQVNEGELAFHLVNVHEYCTQCQLVCRDYSDHRIEIHHRCRGCGQEFQNDNELNMVSNERNMSWMTMEC